MNAKLIIDSSEISSDLYYRTSFLAPDPVIYIESDKRILIVSDLELDRARAVSGQNGSVFNAVSQSKLNKEYGLKGADSSIETVICYLRDNGINDIDVPASFQVIHADRLREAGFHLNVIKGSFYKEREVKTEQEISFIKDAVAATDAVMEHAVGIISSSIIKGDTLIFEDAVLTPEFMRRKINIFLLEREMLAQHTIVSSAEETAFPHNEGCLPLRPHQPIILDIFPRSTQTRYFADMTRTVVKGNPCKSLVNAYNAVYAAQQVAFDALHAGVDSSEVHKKVQAYFVESGFVTGSNAGRMEGFFHGTGHGVGLDIHEHPRIGSTGSVLKENNIITVEPGLYYAEFGGVRIEDIVVIKNNGIVNLNKYEKKLIVNS